MEKIKELEDQLKTAMLNSDVTKLDSLLSEDLIFTNHLGQVMTKSDDLNAHKSGFAKIKSIKFSEQKINKTENCGVVSVKTKIIGYFGKEQSTANLRFTRVWENFGKKNWQLVCGHSTLIE